jgi:F0F1-type ATP synthase assembly protein I
MNRDNLNHSRNEEGALWSIVGYLISGLLIWGGIGYALDQWLGTSYFLLLGMLLGAGAAIYLVWLRFGRE